MTERLREPAGVLGALVVLMLMLVFCSDDVSSTPSHSLSVPAPHGVPVPSPLSEAERPPWANLSLSLDTPWRPLWAATAAVADSAAHETAAAGASPGTAAGMAPRVVRSEHPMIVEARAPTRRRRRRGLFGWLKRRRPNAGTTELERAPDPPMPDSLRHTRGMQFGIRF